MDNIKKAIDLIEYAVIKFANNIKENDYKILVNEEQNGYFYLKKKFDEEKILLISNENHNDIIFSHDIYNYYFRAMHDFIHFQNEYDFSLDGEFKTYQKQYKELKNILIETYPKLDKKTFKDIKKILFIEIFLQAIYYNSKKEFLSNQKEFLYDNWNNNLFQYII